MSVTKTVIESRNSSPQAQIDNLSLRNEGAIPNKEVSKLSLKQSSYYGVTTKPNIRTVFFGRFKMDPWYGNAAYFYPQDQLHSILGYEYSNKIAVDPMARKRIKSVTTEDPEFNFNENIWLDELYVCPFCFKYTSEQHKISQHQVICEYNKPRPNVGKLVYFDEDHYIIREVRGFENPLFCQNMCLFGKLFLDDKSVYYNIDHFSFYVIYGLDNRVYKPMGYFSKEILSYDLENNLACICVFPPFQRRHLGSLLIEFSYELAKVTPGQFRTSGPEFPLSPYGRMGYLNYWSKKIAHEIFKRKKKKQVTIDDISKCTGFRKEDVMLTLENMKILIVDDKENVLLSLKCFEDWCKSKNFDPGNEQVYLNRNCILL